MFDATPEFNSIKLSVIVVFVESTVVVVPLTVKFPVTVKSFEIVVSPEPSAVKIDPAAVVSNVTAPPPESVIVNVLLPKDIATLPMCIVLPDRYKSLNLFDDEPKS